MSKQGKKFKAKNNDTYDSGFNPGTQNDFDTNTAGRDVKDKFDLY